MNYGRFPLAKRKGERKRGRLRKSGRRQREWERVEEEEMSFFLLDKCLTLLEKTFIRAGTMLSSAVSLSHTDRNNQHKDIMTELKCFQGLTTFMSLKQIEIHFWMSQLGRYIIRLQRIVDSSHHPN